MGAARPEISSQLGSQVEAAQGVVFSSSKVRDLLFWNTRCLRRMHPDQDDCFPPGHPLHGFTHSGRS